VWNPVTGCSKVSQGCRNCYAERMAKRLRGRFGYPGDDPFRVTVHLDRTIKPLLWKKPRRIFVCSMGDLFHADVSTAFIATVFAAMALSPRHIFQVLTKRPQRMESILTCKDWHDLFRIAWQLNALRFGLALPPANGNLLPLPNVWLGTSIEDQTTADERIPWLLRTPAALRFVSCEPLLGPVALDGGINYDRKVYPCDDDHEWGHGGGLEGWNALTGEYHYYSEVDGEQSVCWLDETIDWVIVGGESGPGARPMHPDWARSLRAQCQDAGVSFFFKQWGEWLPNNQVWGRELPLNGRKHCWETDCKLHSVKIGKKAMGEYGRLLDGRRWNEFPVDGEV